MNQLIESNKLTMSSLDFLNEVINPIREEFGESKLQNRHFLIKVEDELDDIGAGNFITRYGNKVKVYNLTHDQMMLIGMRESKQVRKKVLLKLKDIELKNNALPNFNDPVEAARAWADTKENEIKALAVIKEQAPKVEYFDRVSRNETLMNATTVAQKIGLSAVTMNKHLTLLGVYNRVVKRCKTFSQDFIDKGYGRMITSDLGYSQAVFTTKGEQYVIEKLTSEGII